jgi:putative SOS response-associated peptidase YedK
MADGFYEWRKTDKKPHFISLRSGEQMAFAGLWETWSHPKAQLIAVRSARQTRMT